MSWFWLKFISLIPSAISGYAGAIEHTEFSGPFRSKKKKILMSITTMTIIHVIDNIIIIMIEIK